MKNLVNKITQTTEKNREKLLAYITLSHNVPTNNYYYNMGTPPYRAWEEEPTNWKLR